MQIRMALAGVMILAMIGCASEPPAPTPAGGPTETVTLKVPFGETFADVEGAKRVVFCQFKDLRPQSAYVGEGFVGNRATTAKYVLRDDPTLVLPRVLAGTFKKAGFNVSLSDRLQEVVGNEAIREVLKRYDADYLIAGRLSEFTVRGRTDEGQALLITVSARLDIYNKDGELRMYYPVMISDARFLGDKAGDPDEVSGLVATAVESMFDRVFEDDFFCKQFDLDPAAVREMMKAKPAPLKPGETKPEEAKPAETKPADAKPAEPVPAEPKPVEPAPVEPKKDATDASKKTDAARELDAAVKDTPKP